MKPPSKKVALLVHNLEEGGMQTVCLNLLQAFIQQPEIEVELILSNQTGNFLDRVPDNTKVTNLNLPFRLCLQYILNLSIALSKHLRQSKPDFILSNLPFINFVTLIAKFFSRTKVSTILVEHTIPLNQQLQREKNQKINKRFVNIVTITMRLLYPYANHIVVPSHGMAKELHQVLGFKPNNPSNLKVIYNPVVDKHLHQKSQVRLDHPWFQKNQPPVFLAVGRLTPQKDYATLIHAFKALKQEMPARLMILGDGDLRIQIEKLIQDLDLETDVLLSGFVDNPYALMSRATAFVLSSVWETFGVVIVEALACGCPVIATDCNYGPAEILSNGKYGILVPSQNSKALAEAMKNILKASNWDKKELQNRADEFSLNQAANQYLKIMGANINNSTEFQNHNSSTISYL
jgi:glycosyltransferase involved in cell wall biosynthesis